jgi:hypothetical protein
MNIGFQPAVATVARHLLLPGVVVLAGCAGGSSQAPLTQALSIPARQASAGAPSRSWISPDAKKAHLLYASEDEGEGNGFINVYDQKGKNQAPIGQFAGLDYPVGLFVDKHGDLYVANSNGFNVPVYHRGTATPFETLLDPGEYPNAVTMDSNGTVYVASTITPSHTAGNVAVYAGGSTTPTSTLTDPNWFSAIAVTVDSSDNLYVCFDTPSGPFGVDEFLAGTTTPINLGLNLEHSCDGLVKDRQQNLVVADPGALTVDVFPPGSTSPSITFPAGSGFPGNLAFASAKKLYASGDSGVPEVDEYAYPGGKVINTITKGFQQDFCVCGVATDPLVLK